MEYNVTPIRLCKSGCDPDRISDYNEDIIHMLDRYPDRPRLQVEIDRVAGDANAYPLGCENGVCVPAALARTGLQEVIYRNGLFLWGGNQTIDY